MSKNSKRVISVFDMLLSFAIFEVKEFLTQNFFFARTFLKTKNNIMRHFEVGLWFNIFKLKEFFEIDLKFR